MAIWYILWQFGIFYGNLVYFMAIWYILWQFGIFYGHLVYFMDIYVNFVVVWYIFSHFGMLYLAIKIWHPRFGSAEAALRTPSNVFCCSKLCQLFVDFDQFLSEFDHMDKNSIAMLPNKLPGFELVIFCSSSHQGRVFFGFCAAS
jgi:hypothetical protein